MAVNGDFNPNMRAVPMGDLISPARKTNGRGIQADDTHICVVMVGLPARGKSLIAQKGAFLLSNSPSHAYTPVLIQPFSIQLSAIFIGSP